MDLSLPEALWFGILVVQVLESGWRLVVNRRLDRHQTTHEVELFLLLRSR